MSANIPTQQILALNDAETSENRIHSDDIALKHGFKGALVSGVNVFGYLTQPLVRVYGEDWLSRGVLDVVFIKPAYQDELLTIKTDSANDEFDHRSHVSCAYDEDDALLAKLESWLPVSLPEINELAYSKSGPEQEARPEIDWDLIHVMEPAPNYEWQPGQDENKEHVDSQRDQSPVYQGSEALIHPYFILDACNKALMRMFVLPAWIHTGSRLVIRRPIRVGQTLEVKTIPIDKWERKGHQFIKLYIAMLDAGEVVLEVEHTAIFRIAG